MENNWGSSIIVLTLLFNATGSLMENTVSAQDSDDFQEEIMIGIMEEVNSEIGQELQNDLNAETSEIISEDFVLPDIASSGSGAFSP